MDQTLFPLSCAKNFFPRYCLSIFYFFECENKIEGNKAKDNRVTLDLVDFLGLELHILVALLVSSPLVYNFSM